MRIARKSVHQKPRKQIYLKKAYMKVGLQRILPNALVKTMLLQGFGEVTFTGPTMLGV
jgi:hypothetical protein